MNLSSPSIPFSARRSWTAIRWSRFTPESSWRRIHPRGRRGGVMVRSGRFVGIILTTVFCLMGSAAWAQSVSPSASPSPTPSSIDLLRAKAEAGDASAQYQLATAYHLGTGVPQDDAQAFAWTLKSAQGGFPHAACVVGWYYASGLGVDKNMTEALKWFKKAADRGSPDGMIQLASIYLYGSYDDPADRDPKKGIAYAFAAAIYLHNSTAFSFVANCYARGIFVKADLSYAYAYALCSDSIKPTEWNSKHLAKYKSKLTPEQLARAEEILALLQKRMGFNQADRLSFNLSGHPRIKTPFRRVINFLIVTASVGNHPPANFILDTGCTATSLDSRYAASLGIQSNDWRVSFALDAEPNLSSVSEPMSLSLGAATWPQIRFEIAPLPIDGYVGEPIAGVIGSDVLNELVVHIDYEHNILEFIDPKFFHPTADLGEPLPLVFKPVDDVPFVPASIVNGGVESKKETFLFDTGDNGTMETEPGFWADNRGVSFTAKHPGEVAGFDGVSVPLVDYLCSAVVLGSMRLEQVPAEGSLVPRIGNLNPNGGQIGNEIWRRFDVTLDYPGRRIFLKKNSHFNDPFDDSAAGLEVVASGSDYQAFTVLQILPGLPGALAGFQPGDVILKINDRDHLTIDQIWNAFGAAGDYHVLVQRQGHTLVLNLHCPDVSK